MKEKKIVMLSGMNYQNEDDLTIAFSAELQSELKRILKGKNKITFIASDPLNCTKTDVFVDKILHAFHNCSIHFLSVKKIDHRTAKRDCKLDANQVVFLCGGHTSEQMKFLKHTKLNKKIKQYSGVIIGLSAGSINMAKQVFVTPDDYNNQVTEFYSGLGLIDFVMHPHFDISDSDQVEMFKNFANNFHFYALPNSSFIIIENGATKIFGDCYEFFSGDYKFWSKGYILSPNSQT